MEGKLRTDGLFKIYRIVKKHFDFDSIDDSKCFKNWISAFIGEIAEEVIKKEKEEYTFENFREDWGYLTKTRIMLERNEELKEIYDKL